MATEMTLSYSEQLLAYSNARMQEMQPYSSSPSETSSLASYPLGERVDNDSEGEEWSAEGFVFSLRHTEVAENDEEIHRISSLFFS